MCSLHILTIGMTFYLCILKSISMDHKRHTAFDYLYCIAGEINIISKSLWETLYKYDVFQYLCVFFIFMCVANATRTTYSKKTNIFPTSDEL